MARGDRLAVQPAKVVVGKEPEKTNLFLQALAQASPGGTQRERGAARPPVIPVLGRKSPSIEHDAGVRTRNNWAFEVLTKPPLGRGGGGDGGRQTRRAPRRRRRYRADPVAHGATALSDEEIAAAAVTWVGDAGVPTAADLDAEVTAQI